jgi:hypothetical protein
VPKKTDQVKNCQQNKENKRIKIPKLTAALLEITYFMQSAKRLSTPTE